MRLSQKDLQNAVEEKIITSEQAKQLHLFWQNRATAGPIFDFSHVLYYLGGLLAIGAMSLFMNLGWESFGGWGIVGISMIYAFLGLRLCHYFRKKDYLIPAGICATFVVVLTPLAIYGLQQALGFWPDETTYRQYYRLVLWHWVYMELATLIVAAVIIYIYRSPFLVMPIAVTFWYLSMDLAPFLIGKGLTFELRALISLYFGLLMLVFAFWVDIRARKTVDYAFWLYLFGIMAFWGGLTAQNSDNEWSKLLYFIINLVMVLTGVALSRRVFVVFGAFGAVYYLGYLAREIFQDSWLFPITLTLIGLLIVFAGIGWQRNEQHYTHKLRGYLPQPLRELLENSRT